MRIRIGVCSALCCLLAGSPPLARAVDDMAVRKAIARGVEYLKRSQSSEGLWNRSPSGTMGASALAGLALLECEVRADDPAIQKLAPALRDGSLALTDTYSLALCILFFDRLGEAGDVPLIESLTVRLLAGQNADGGWTYECPKINEAELSRLKKVIQQGRANDPKREASEKKRTVHDLPPEIQHQLLQVERLRQEGGGGGISDNSNTQFATLALWVGHRHGLPVAKALARVEAYFRGTQNADGGWGYNAAVSGTTPAMICAGLLGLATSYGIVNEARVGTGSAEQAPGHEEARSPKDSPRPAKPRAPRDPARDASVRAGLLALGAMIGPGTPGGPGLVLDSGPKLGPTGRFPNYYFLWSLERVAVIYGLQTIGNKDWYSWGAEFALTGQRRDGSWDGGYPDAGVDTSFALLFLERSNLVQDLTRSLRGRVRDPGQVAMSAGRVGSAQAKQNAGPAKEGTGSAFLPALPRPDQFTPGSSSRVADPEAARLSVELVQAAPAQRDALLAKLREGKGLVHTQALAAAIPHLTGATKTKARDALAERMARMTAATLEDKLRDEDLEIRRAAALACAMKEEKKLIPSLIATLEDPEPPVSRAAHAALKALTGQDFGPVPDASRAESAKALLAWRVWWNKQRASLPSADRPAADPALAEQERIQGTWVLAALERESKTVPKGALGYLHIKLIFKGDQVTFEYPDHTELGTYTLDTTTDPKTIDVVKELDTSKGIYRLEGDSLTICGVPAGDERPAEFRTKPGTKQVLWVLKRQKP